ncbi:MAG: glycosyltransferase [Bacteroidetes bacterium]|nr:glycosyltransferase [Bacteroidota bacterium]
MEDKLLSVCLITYNHASILVKRLKVFLRKSKLFNWELIIADDFSNDGTRRNYH